MRPTAGEVHFAGRDITRAPAWERAVLGIVYTFQVTSIYRRLSVHDNVALAAQRRRLRTALDWVALDRGAVAAAVQTTLAQVVLADLRDQRAGALAYGHQRVLEVAMALALEPKLLILDEPTQGLAGDEIEALCRLVRSIGGTTTVLLIEHNMPVVLDLADRVTVMDRGQKSSPRARRARSRRIPGFSARIWGANAMETLTLSGPMTLKLGRVNCYYEGAHVLRDVSFEVAAGEVLGLLGRNGAGKTTTLRAVMGLVRARSGSITLDATDLLRLPAHEIPRRGIAYVPQGRRLFSDLTVAENLRMGLLVRGGGEETLAPVLELFPLLRERLRQRAGTLSGGEQQMLATARALCARPTFLLMDEPTEGLMPALVDRLLATVTALRARGVGIVLVEQKVDAVLRVADRVALIENGRIVREATPAELSAEPEILLRYIGVRR